MYEGMNLSPRIGANKVGGVGMRCRHCDHPRNVQKRGLCKKCYDNPIIKALYPDARYGRRNVEEYQGRTASVCIGHDPISTDAQPGSEEKMKVLCRRAKAGYELFNPDDCTALSTPFQGDL